MRFGVKKPRSILTTVDLVGLLVGDLDAELLLA
jgi:hypothetical protein